MVDWNIIATAGIEQLSPAESGGIQATMTTDRPQLVLQGEFVDRYVHVEMMVTPEADAPAFSFCRLYYLEVGQGTFDDEHSLVSEIERFGEPCIYDFHCLPFQRTRVVGLRFDPANFPGKLEVRDFSTRPREEPSAAPSVSSADGLAIAFVAYFSRSGSTALMKMLEAHPEVAGWPRGSRDAHLLTYLTKFHLLLTDSHLGRGARRDSEFAARLARSYRFGAEQIDLPRPVEFNDFIDLSRLRECYSTFVRSFFSTVVATGSGKPRAKCYVEKLSDLHGPRLVEALQLIVPNAKTISLWRDPRDIYLSYRSYQQKESMVDEAVLGSDLVEGIVGTLQRRLDHCAKLGQSALHVRYESLMSDPFGQAERIARFLGVDDGHSAVAEMVTGFRRRDRFSMRHITSARSGSSVGRHRREGDDEVRRRFAPYRELIESLGYEWWAARRRGASVSRVAAALCWLPRSSGWESWANLEPGGDPTCGRHR